MKKILGLFLLLSFCITLFAGTNVVLPKKPSKLNANEILIPIGKNGEQVSLMDFSRMKVKDLEAITGEKMSFGNKVKFTIGQKQLRNSINADGTIDNKVLTKAFAKAHDEASGFNLVGLALGLLLGLIGVLIAYLIKDEKKYARVKWAWIGFGIWLVILLLAFVL